MEFFKPGSSVASAKWEFPVVYTGSGVDDDMWLDKAYLRQLIAKAARPTLDCSYRILLSTHPGAAISQRVGVHRIPFDGTIGCSSFRHGHRYWSYDGRRNLLEVVIHAHHGSGI